MVWLGEKRGNLSDWTTQRWVRATGRSASLVENPWLDGPIGSTDGIGSRFFETYAAAHGLEVVEAGTRGLLPHFDLLADGNPAAGRVAREVKEFYERTSNFQLDAWSEWGGFFRPFGRLLSLIFSTRLQQLNVPLSPLDSAKGMTSRVLHLRNSDGETVHTAWMRELHATGNVLYAGCYSACRVPGHPSPCVKVVFPLPNGNAIVLMKVVAESDGSLALHSAGKRFGDPGFYFTVRRSAGDVWARYVPSMKETIRVYAAEPGVVRADHCLRLWGMEFLRLHYRMTSRVSR